MAEPLLNLDTLVERATVIINKKSYEMKKPGEVSLLDYHWVSKQSEKLEGIFAQTGPLTMEQVGSLASSIDELCRFILFAPDEVHKGLLEIHKLRIIQTFTDLLRGDVTTLAGEKPTAPEPGTAAETPSSTGESTSPAS